MPLDISINLLEKKENLTVLSAEPAGKIDGRAWFKKISIMGRVSMHEKIILNRNLASMLGAGLPLSRALAIIEHQSKNPKLKKVK